jgi:DNA-directed RNA polymerase
MILEQLELEQSMMDSGKFKYLQNADKKLHNDFESTHVQMIIKHIIFEFGEHIQAKLDEYNEVNKSIKKKGALYDLLSREINTYNPNYEGKQQRYITAELLSYSATRYILNGLISGDKRNDSTVFSIGTNVNDNLSVDDKLSDNAVVAVGHFLVNEFVDKYSNFAELYTGYFWTFKGKKLKRTDHPVNIIRPTDEYIKLVAENRDLIAELSNDMLPMITKPVDWDHEGNNGGYYSSELKRDMVKPSGVGRKPNDGCKVNDKVIRALNATQSTPWRVNGWLLDILVKLTKNPHHKLTKIFPHDIPKVAKCSIDVKKKDKTPEEKLLANEYYDKYNYSVKKRQKKSSLDLSRIAAISQAERFRQYDEIFFPFDIDYRDRFYSIPMSGLNIQGSDTCKALVEFANGKPIKTERGLFWYKVNLAALCGQDKLTLEDRVKWCDNNESLIKAVANNPLDTIDIWCEFDKQLQGLVACKGYADYLEDPKVLLRVPVALDGTCNAMQHLSAITRDPVVAEHVGLIPTPTKGDLYTHVLRGVETILIAMDDELSQLWLSSMLVKRDLTKTPVMIRSYGAVIGTVKEHCIELIMDSYMDDDKSIHATEHFKGYNPSGNPESKKLGHEFAGDEMAQIIWDAMVKYMAGPMAFMLWSQQCASVLGKAGLTVTWYNAAGMLCEHKPRKSKIDEVKITVEGHRIKYKRNVVLDDIKSTKLKSSVAPNLIHGQDASGLVLTVCECLDHDVTDFALVHDSYATHADDSQVMIDSIKYSWVDMYQDNNWMQIWWDRWAKQIDEVAEKLIAAGKKPKVTSKDLPDVLILGNLEAKSVLTSDYFFA